MSLDMRCIWRHVVYALHAFQKKSAKGIATPKAEIALIKQRLKEAYIHYEQEIGDSK
jgi:phage-related protein